MGTELREQPVQRVAAVGAAAHDDQRAARGADVDCLGCLPVLDAEGAVADRGVIGEPQRRRGHDAEHRLVVAHQRDVDGELAVATDEFLGAVERVHQPELEPRAADREGVRGLGFLRQHGDRRRQRRELPREDLVGRAVGTGDRRLVGLVLDAVGGGVDLEDGRRGFRNCVEDTGQQGSRIGTQGGSPARRAHPVS